MTMPEKEEGGALPLFGERGAPLSPLLHYKWGPDGATVVLNADELAIYNEIVRDISKEGKANVTYIDISSGLERLLYLQGMMELLE